jgi:hypothetical protein
VLLDRDGHLGEHLVHQHLDDLAGDDALATVDGELRGAREDLVDRGAPDHVGGLRLALVQRVEVAGARAAVEVPQERLAGLAVEATVGGQVDGGEPAHSDTISTLTGGPHTASGSGRVQTSIELSSHQRTITVRCALSHNR